MKSLYHPRNTRGQGMVEYGLILALAAVVVIAALTIMGPSVGKVFSTVTNKVAPVTTCLAASSGCAPGNFAGGAIPFNDSTSKTVAIAGYCNSPTPSGTGYNIYLDSHGTYSITNYIDLGAPAGSFQGVGVCP